MRVTLSAAVTSDGYLDDNTPNRLMISTSGDWDAVYRLRAAHDAILVGAETLRRDNPALLIRNEATRERRRATGLRPDITKVTLTQSRQLTPTLRFFTEGDADRYVFSPTDIPELKGIAEVIATGASITAARIVTELEKRGIHHLIIEGGARILRLFLREDRADTVRLAVNPALTLGPGKGGARFDFLAPSRTPHIRENVDGMQVTTYTLHPDTTAQDLRNLRTAIAQSRRCTPSNSSYCVGAVVVTADGKQFTGYTHETSPTHHAEQEAIAKALAAGARLRGAAMYSSMEPCSKRSSEPESCSELIFRHGFSHVAFALYEPDHFVDCRGALTLREAGIDVRAYPELGDEVRQINAHLLK